VAIKLGQEVLAIRANQVHGSLGSIHSGGMGCSGGIVAALAADGLALMEKRAGIQW
jgi:hypothetical protein